ncbi:MAG: 50S ribosomal protein L11 methyltransferase [Myxococcota bacterium]
MSVHLRRIAAQPWEFVDAIAPLDPWCLEVDEVSGTIDALFPIDPALGPEWQRITPEIARFGSGWRPDLKATQVGPLWILPPGRRAPSGSQRRVIVEALVAFGAGTHETTLMCLEKVVERSPVPEVLDVGTGSGVLAIAALLLGAKRAVGTDLEDRLLDEARKNAVHSGVEARLTTTTARVEALDRRFPLVIANVRTPALITLAPALIAATAPGGDLILSGIRIEEREELMPAFGAVPLVSEASRGDWLRLDFQPS